MRLSGGEAPVRPPGPWLTHRFMLRGLLVVLALLVAAGCAPRGENVADDATGSRTDDLVILLTAESSQAGTYQILWPDYRMPIFALWPDGRMLVLQRGGWGAGTPVYLEAHLDQRRIDTLRGWVKEAKVSSLADTYPRPLTAIFRRIIGSESSTSRLQLRDGAMRTDVTFGTVPGAGLLYPVRLKTLVDRLRAYRPTDTSTFVHNRIEVVLTEDASTAAKGLFPLPAEFSLEAMTEIFRSVDEVRYSKTFMGAEAGRIAARVDAGESVYQDATRSYRIEYRPLLEWPKP